MRSSLMEQLLFLFCEQKGATLFDRSFRENITTNADIFLLYSNYLFSKYKGFTNKNSMMEDILFLEGGILVAIKKQNINCNNIIVFVIACGI